MSYTPGQGGNQSESLRESSQRSWDLGLENVLRSALSDTSSMRRACLLVSAFTVSPVPTTVPDTKEATDKYLFSESMYGWIYLSHIK